MITQIQTDLFQSAIDLGNEYNLRKYDFLNRLKSKKGYKRYQGPPLRYGGGKSLAVGKLVEHLPNNLTSVVSPFFGGGSFEIAIAKELGISVIGYDIFELLVNYWDVQINDPESLYFGVIQLKNTKDEYERIKEILKTTWNKKHGLLKHNLTKLDLASYYYFNHNLSYGPGFLGWMSSIYLDERKYFSLISKVKKFNVKNISVSLLSFDVSIPRHQNEFLYLDPPYFLEGDSKMFKGIYPMRNFPVHHNGFNHLLLSELLKEHRGGFLLSYNDCAWVREAYSDFEIIEIDWQYTMGQGETRIGKNRSEREFDNTNVKMSHELLIKG
jgi:DNA adenine methylase